MLKAFLFASVATVAISFHAHGNSTQDCLKNQVDNFPKVKILSEDFCEKGPYFPGIIGAIRDFNLSFGPLKLVEVATGEYERFHFDNNSKTIRAIFPADQRTETRENSWDLRMQEWLVREKYKYLAQLMNLEVSQYFKAQFDCKSTFEGCIRIYSRLLADAQNSDYLKQTIRGGNKKIVLFPNGTHSSDDLSVFLNQDKTAKSLWAPASAEVNRMPGDHYFTHTGSFRHKAQESAIVWRLERVLSTFVGRPVTCPIGMNLGDNDEQCQISLLSIINHDRILEHHRSVELSPFKKITIMITKAPLAEEEKIRSMGKGLVVIPPYGQSAKTDPLPVIQ